MARSPRSVQLSQNDAINRFREEHPDIAALKTRRAVIDQIRQVFQSEVRESSTVENLINVGAMVEWAILNRLFPTRNLQRFIAQETPYTYSYVAMGRRWNNDRQHVRDSIDWYRQMAANRTGQSSTGDAEYTFMYRTSATSGVNFVRDAMRAYDEAGRPQRGPDGRFARGHLEAVDARYPMTRERQVRDPMALTPARRLQRLEALCLYCISAMARGDAERMAEVVQQFRSASGFLMWSDSSGYTNTQDAAIAHADSTTDEDWTGWDAYDIPYPLSGMQPQEAIETANENPWQDIADSDLSPDLTPEEKTSAAMRLPSVRGVIEGNMTETRVRRFFMLRFSGRTLTQAREEANAIGSEPHPNWGTQNEGPTRVLQNAVRTVDQFPTNEATAPFLRQYADARRSGMSHAEARDRALNLVRQQEMELNADVAEVLSMQVDTRRGVPEEHEERQQQQG